MAFDHASRQAAISLGEHLKGKSWFSSVGISGEEGNCTLIVYTRRRLVQGKGDVPCVWEGLPVRLQVVGRILPAQTNSKL